MRPILLLIALFCSTSFTRVCATEPADAKAEIADATQAWADAFNSRHTERVVAHYAPDAVLCGTRSQIVRATPELIREYFSSMPSQPHARVTLGESRIRVFGDVAINTGEYTFTGRAADGTPTASPARHTFVFAKRGGRWLIVEHHSSSVPSSR